jgi:hypothetical protein
MHRGRNRDLTAQFGFSFGQALHSHIMSNVFACSCVPLPGEIASFHCWRPHRHPWKRTCNVPSPSSQYSYQNTRARYAHFGRATLDAIRPTVPTVFIDPEYARNFSHRQRSALASLERDASSQATRERALESQADARAAEVDRQLNDARQKRLALQRTLDAVACERYRASV